MRTSEMKEEVYTSMAEFEKAFLPNLFKKKLLELPEDPHAAGAKLATESLDTIKRRLIE